MWYHAITDFGEDTRYWWNRTREDLVNELVLPLVSSPTLRLHDACVGVLCSGATWKQRDKECTRH
jgi:hypothetical protein